jgi:diguanylate cyclase (GGDEF)-like protein/PAS domain S-box-containing protein
MELFELTHKDFRPTVEARARARLQGLDVTPPSYEFKIIRRDGAERWIAVNAAIVEMAGAPAALATAVDITERKEAEEALRENEHWLRTLAETTATAIVVYSSERFLYANHACEKLTGYLAAELLTLPPQEIIHPEMRREMGQRVAARLRGEEVPSRYEARVLTRDGRERWVDVAAGRLERGGQVLGMATFFDITERKLAEIALVEERERAEVTLASIGDGVIRTDASGLVDYLNAVAERLTGWSAMEAAGQPLARIFDVVDEAGVRPLFDPVERCLREGKVIELPGASVLLRRDGMEFAIRDSVAPIRDRRGRITGTVLVFKDVTELRGLEREMSFLAQHDALTGLLNRRELEIRLERCLRTAREEGRHHALFYLDLDEFKLVNDTSGHLAGDELLKEVTAALAARLRPGDTLARLGGDEFGVLLEDTSPERARVLAETLRAAVRAHRFVWQDRIFEIGVSLGTIMIDRASGDLVQVLSAADAACYVAKEAGRNRIHEYQPDDTLVTERHGVMDWIHRIHKAFDEERFRLYCQPIQPLGPAGDAASPANPPLCEIFIRMVDEEGRIATPSAFIQAAERYHLIPSIDRWVVRAAFSVLTRSTLASADPGTCFAINLSGQSIGEGDFLDYVLGEMEASGMPPERLCFEITETAAVANLTRARRFIATLKARGVRFVLDDFGSGLSSFAYLKNLRVDFLKIDGEFVRNLVGDSVQRALVESIHQIGHVMGIRTIAEAVEDRDTLEALRTIGVDYAQGYWIAAPEPLT